MTNETHRTATVAAMLKVAKDLRERSKRSRSSATLAARDGHEDIADEFAAEADGLMLAFRAIEDKAQEVK